MQQKEGENIPLQQAKKFGMRLAHKVSFWSEEAD